MNQVLNTVEAPYIIADTAFQGPGSGITGFAPGLTTGDSTAIFAALASTAAGQGDALLAVTSIFPNAVATTQDQINSETVSVFRWFTAAQIADVVAGTHLVDCTTAIQNAINDLQALTTPRPTLVFPAGVYSISGVIYVSGNNMHLFGLGSPWEGSYIGSTYRDGATLYCTSATAGIVWGFSPGTGSTFQYSPMMEHFRIEVQNTCGVAMWTWMPYDGFFSDIKIFGNKGVGTGLLNQGSVSTIFERIYVNGSGQTPSGTYAGYLAQGLLMEPAGSSIPTTTIFRRCYFHYCASGASISSLAEFEDCVFESCDYGCTTLGASSPAKFTRCWWEGNKSADFNIGNGTYIFKECRFNQSLFTRTFFFTGSVYGATIEDCFFFNSVSGATLFNTGPNLFSNQNSLITLNRNVYPAATAGSSGGTASFAGNVMTLVTAPTVGAVALGQNVGAAGVVPGVSILNLASGTLNVAGSTYTLSGTPGTIGTTALTTTVPNFNIGGTYNNQSTCKINVEDMVHHQYRWLNLSAAASISYVAMTAAGGGTVYEMPEQGHVLHLRVKTTNAIGSGATNDMQAGLQINGVNVATFATVNLGASQTANTPYSIRLPPYNGVRFNQGDKLTVILWTNSGWTTNDVFVELEVAFGPDGTLVTL